MTGKDVVLFIITHDLLNDEIDVAPIIKKCFLSIEEAAVKIGISTTSLAELIEIGLIDHVIFNDDVYVYKDIDLTIIKGRR